MLATTGALMALAVPDAMAGLPAVVQQGGIAAGSTDWLLWVTNFFDSGTKLFGLLVASVGLIMVVAKVYGMYGEVGKGKATWGDVATSAVGGAAIMMLGAAVLGISAAVF